MAVYDDRGRPKEALSEEAPRVELTFRPTCFVLQKCSKNYIRMHSCSAKKVVWDAIPIPQSRHPPPLKNYVRPFCSVTDPQSQSPIPNPIPNP
jgi:hypothetical protein